MICLVPPPVRPYSTAGRQAVDPAPRSGSWLFWLLASYWLLTTDYWLLPYPFFFSNSCMNDTSASMPASGNAL